GVSIAGDIEAASGAGGPHGSYLATEHDVQDFARVRGELGYGRLVSPPNPFDAAARALLEGAKLSTRPVSWTERQLRRTLGSKPESAGRDTAPSRAPRGATGDRDDAKLAERMNRLLKRGLEQTAAASSQDLYIALVEQLVPDEARILSALSDG